MNTMYHGARNQREPPYLGTVGTGRLAEDHHFVLVYQLLDLRPEILRVASYRRHSPLFRGDSPGRGQQRVEGSELGGMELILTL